MITQYVNFKKGYKNLHTLSIELTYDCDKNCHYCYNPSTRYSGEEELIKLNIYKNNITDFLENTNYPLHIHLIGGEPTKFKYLIELYNFIGEIFKKYYTTDRKLELTLFSHGNAIGIYENLKYFKTHYVLFSWHGTQTNEELFKKNLLVLKKNNILFGTCINTGTSTKDWPKKIEILKYVKNLGGFTQVESIFKDEYKYYFEKAKEVFKDYYHDCFKIHNVLFKKKNKIIKEINYNDFENYKSGLVGKKLCNCVQFTIDPNLDIYPECGFFEEKTKNLNNVSLLEYMNSNRLIQCDKNCLSKSNLINKKVLHDEKNNL
jgi:MoaA/NifB/PqqE/SkfB family radical SAM enzyme